MSERRVARIVGPPIYPQSILRAQACERVNVSTGRWGKKGTGTQGLGSFTDFKLLDGDLRMTWEEDDPLDWERVSEQLLELEACDGAVEYVEKVTRE